MRGSSVAGVSIWDSHNRWLTIHGTDYLVRPFTATARRFR